MSQTDETTNEFILEACELLEDAEQCLLNIDSGENYQTNFNIIFRAFHSIKGGAGMLGLMETNKLVHFLEDVLQEANAKNEFDNKIIDFFLAGIDATRSSLEQGHHKFKMVSPFVKPADVKPLIKEVKNKKSTESKSRGIIFHVDDEEDILEVMQMILETQGYEVKSFLSGKAMLNALTPKACDIVISDFKMPEMSGMEVLDKVKNVDPDIPVIMLSGFLDKNACIEAVTLGAYSLLEKPVNEGLLFATVNNAMESVKFARLINRSMKLLMYQFSDLEQFLLENGKSHIHKTIKTELESLISDRHHLRQVALKKKNAA